MSSGCSNLGAINDVCDVRMSKHNDAELCRGELYVHKNKPHDRREIIQTIELDEDNIYSIKINFR